MHDKTLQNLLMNSVVTIGALYWCMNCGSIASKEDVLKANVLMSDGEA